MQIDNDQCFFLFFFGLNVLYALFRYQPYIDESLVEDMKSVRASITETGSFFQHYVILATKIKLKSNEF